VGTRRRDSEETPQSNNTTYGQQQQQQEEEHQQQQQPPCLVTDVSLPTSDTTTRFCVDGGVVPQPPVVGRTNSRGRQQQRIRPDRRSILAINTPLGAAAISAKNSSGSVTESVRSRRSVHSFASTETAAMSNKKKDRLHAKKGWNGGGGGTGNRFTTALQSKQPLLYKLPAPTSTNNYLSSSFIIDATHKQSMSEPERTATKPNIDTSMTDNIHGTSIFAVPSHHPNHSIKR
jgi:hypothetical protein